MSEQVLTERFRREIFQCLEETFESVQGIYLDKGTSLFETLENISAGEASHALTDSSATIAAQVEHIRFYLDVLDGVIRKREFTKVDWREIWRTVREVTPEEWEDLKGRLRESYRRVLDTLQSSVEWETEEEISGALAVLTHTAYHLGGIRQAWAGIRAARMPIER